MNRVLIAGLVLLVASFSALFAADRATDEPTIRPDPRPADLTTGRRGTSDEPTVRQDPRARDFSAPKTAAGRSTLEVNNLTLEQSDRIRAIRQRAVDEIQAIRDRERAEIMQVLNDEQRAEFVRLEREQNTPRTRRATTLPATTQASS